MVKVFKYGLLEPTEGAALIREQCNLAWRYAVALARMETAYRARRREREAAALPTVAQIAALTEQVETVRAALRAAKSRTAVREDTTWVRASLTSLREQIKALRPEAATERAAFRASGILSDLYAEQKTARLALVHQFTAAGMFWGQRNLVQYAHDQRRTTWGEDVRIPDGWGLVGTQLQKKLPVADVASSPIVRLTAERPVPGRHGKPRPRLRVRIGQHDGVAEWPIVLHRPLPEGALISHVTVTREQVGRQTRWSAHFTLDLPDPAQTAGDGGLAVAVVPRFARDREADGLCAADVATTTGERVRYLLHPAIVGGLDRAESLQGIRDTRRDVILTAVSAWMPTASLPAEWPRQIARWESCDRLRAFVMGWWRAHRVAGDDEVYRAAQAWAYQDEHLWDYAAHARRGAIDRRTHDYRVWAAQLAEQYEVVVLPKTNYARMARRPSEPERDGLSRAAGHQRMMAAPGLLRSLLVSAFESRGRRVLLSPHQDAETMLRERSGAAEKKRIVRAAKFHARHRGAGMEAGAEATADA